MSKNSPSVKAMFILDSDGSRICSKYYDKSYSTLADQHELEQKIYTKTKNTNARMDAEIIMLNDIICVYTNGGDTTLYVVGSSHENEIILNAVLDGTFDALSSLLKGHTDRRVMLENLELVLLTFDEVIDGGIILETNTQSITNRVLMRGIDNEVPITELTISQAFASAKQQFSKSFMK